MVKLDSKPDFTLSGVPGSVPAPTEANRREAIIVPPWAAEKPMELGENYASGSCASWSKRIQKRIFCTRIWRYLKSLQKQSL